MIAVLDHKDSFTYNLVHMLQLEDQVQVFDQEEAFRLDPSLFSTLVFSPGPGQPEDYPASIQIYQKARGHIAILGVCLGFQLILHAEGAQTVRQEKVLHGVRTSLLTVPDSQAYRDIPETIAVGRYHSLQIDPKTVPTNVEISGWDKDASIPLSFEIPELEIYGFQFHPDSFLTDNGQKILKNCLRGRLES